jgi:hypothetical protein
MHIGIISTGKDGLEYRSELEKTFVDRYLYGLYEYEYEKSYDIGTRHTCDFYLPLFKLWVEVVPYSSGLFDIETRELIPQIIYMPKVTWHTKHLVKPHGAKWDPDYGSWYISSAQLSYFRTTGNLKDFLPEFDTESIDQSINTEYQNFLQYYKNIEMKKSIIEGRKEIFCTVTSDDMKYESLLHLLQAKNMDGWKFIRAIENLRNRPIKIKSVDSAHDVVWEVVNFIKHPKASTKILTNQQKEQIGKAIFEVANSFSEDNYQLRQNKNHKKRNNNKHVTTKQREQRLKTLKETK